MFFYSNAKAATATFVTPSSLDDSTLASVSSGSDGAGLLLGLNETFAILLSTPVGTASSDRVSIFTIAPSSGVAIATVRFGVFNGGGSATEIVRTTRVRAGRTLSIGNLFNRGCGVLGGCDYIEIITTRTRRGAEGVEVDYVDVNGEVVDVASPTPEPSTWALMIIAFMMVAIRLKMKKYRRLPANSTNQLLPLAMISTPHNPVWRG